LITPENSKIEFFASRSPGVITAAFETFSGPSDYAVNPKRVHVTITIDTGSVTTDTPDLTKHLKTADFFEGSQGTRKQRLESTEIKAGGEKGTTHTVTGNLQLHGVTKSITFPANDCSKPGSDNSG